MGEKLKELVAKAKVNAAKYADQYASTEQVRSALFEEKFTECLVALVVECCVEELEINKECDPYTGALFESEKNKVISEQVETLKEVFELKDLK